MFEFLRVPSRKRNIVVYIVFGAIALVFVFMDAGSLVNPGQNPVGYAAQVNKESISLYEFQSARSRYEQFYSRMFGMNYGDDPTERQRLSARVIEQLIDQELVAQHAESQLLLAPDAEIAGTIRSIPYLQTDGRFDMLKYQGMLKQMGVSAGLFEKEIRRQLLFEKVRNLFSRSLLPSQKQIDLLIEAKKTKVNVDYVNIKKDLIQLSPQELSAFAANSENAEKLLKHYDANKGTYSNPERILARHILIKVDPTQASSDADALKKIKDLLPKAKGEDFAALAAAYSEDEASKINGGDLGYFARGTMDPNFEKAAFDLKEQEVSEPVRSMFGYHLIKLEKREAAKQLAFEEVKERVAKDVASAEKFTSIKTQLEAGLANENQKEVEAIIKSNQLQWTETGAFDITQEFVPKLGKVENFAEVAFTLSKDAPMPKSLVQDADSAYVIRLKSKESKDLSVQEQESVKRELEMQASQAVFETWMSSVKEKAKIKLNPKLI